MNRSTDKLEAIGSILDYIERIRRNREIIEGYYLSNQLDKMQKEIYNLFEGIIWIEYAVIELKIPFHKGKKDKLFYGISEAMEMLDWLTVIDFISYDFMEYLQLLEQSLTDKYTSIIGGSR
jgi:hypothetical protein